MRINSDILFTQYTNQEQVTSQEKKQRGKTAVKLKYFIKT